MMADVVKSGYSSFDLADHYGPAEDLIGMLHAKLRKDHPQGYEMQAFTKWVPRPGPVSRSDAEKAVGISLKRMNVSALDLMQYHWWDYALSRDMMDGLKHLDSLRKEGKIKNLALTNFDTAHLEAIIASGIPIVSNQVQFSLVDSRPAQRMAPFCDKHGLKLLAYGTLAGGFLTDKWLGAPEPRSRNDIPTPSLGKYFNMIRSWGDWALFQELLRTCKAVGDRHQVSIANVAVRWVLEQQAVGGAIIGLRAGISNHAEENARVFQFELSAQDKADIAAVLKKGNNLMQVIGDCGDEYRG